MRPLLVWTVAFAALFIVFALAVSATERAGWDADNAQRIMEIE